ncbi:MAG: SGNH/GDSL hydrolase family protein [Burkholderiales bacterium]
MTTLRKLFVTAALAGLTSAASAYPFDSLYIFGDSLSDSGNNALVIGTNGAQPITNSYIPSQPYGPGQGLGQYTNGNVWAYSFASAIGLADYARPSLSLLPNAGNYAAGGARTSVDGLYYPGKVLPSLKTQAKGYLASTGGTASASALYVVAGGGNDARDALEAAAADPGNAVSIITRAALTYAFNTGRIVDSLQAAGAQHIVVWDVPNLGITPAVSAEGSLASFLGNLVSKSMSNVLTARMSGEAGVTLFDFYSLSTSWAADPGAFGFVNATDACGGVLGCDPSTYAFWDGIHPTSAGHALIAEAMFAAVVPEPETVVLMIAGLALVAWRVRRRA